MSRDSRQHKRRSIRIPRYDYARPGAYFITLCVHDRKPVFGKIIDGEMRLNAAGEITRTEWLLTPGMRREIELDEFVVMPDHFHAIVFIRERGDNTGHGGHFTVDRSLSRRVVGDADITGKPGPRNRSLAACVGGFKSGSAKRVNALRGTPGIPLWQRDYYEHVIRNERELERIRRYIRENPMRWHMQHNRKKPL